jgi:protein-S-isoprenylcysteine O-methyltransferase Ste14
MFPVLAFMYVRLARAEERQALAEFGAEYERYMQATPAFFPKLPTRGRARLANG